MILRSPYLMLSQTAGQDPRTRGGCAARAHLSMLGKIGGKKVAFAKASCSPQLARQLRWIHRSIIPRSMPMKRKAQKRGLLWTSCHSPGSFKTVGCSYGASQSNTIVYNPASYINTHLQTNYVPSGTSLACTKKSLASTKPPCPQAFKPGGSCLQRPTCDGSAALRYQCGSTERRVVADGH